MPQVKDGILERILQAITITPTGLRWSRLQSLELSRLISLLISELMLDKKFQSKLEGLKYSFESGDEGISFPSAFTPILKEMKQNNENSYDQFRHKINDVINNIETQSKPVKFELYYPINITTTDSIQMIKFQDTEVELKQYKEVKDLLETKDLNDALRFEKFTRSKYQYLKITLWARNQTYAQKICTQYANLILGVITYSQSQGRITISMVGPPKALTEIKLNYVFAFRESTYSGYYYFADKTDDRKIINITTPDAINLNNFVTAFNKADKKIQDITYKTMSLYYQGLSENNIDYSFLNFWRALEIITIKNRQVKHIEVIRRLKSIIRSVNSIDNYNLDRIYRLRNEFVHNGAGDISQYDRNLLKIYLELMMEFFISNLISYDISEVQEIFQFLQKENDSLIKSKNLVDFVIKLKTTPINVTEQITKRVDDMEV